MLKLDRNKDWQLRLNLNTEKQFEVLSDDNCLDRIARSIHEVAHDYLRQVLDTYCRDTGTSFHSQVYCASPQPCSMMITDGFKSNTKKQTYQRLTKKVLGVFVGRLGFRTQQTHRNFAIVSVSGTIANGSKLIRQNIDKLQDHLRKRCSGPQIQAEDIRVAPYDDKQAWQRECMEQFEVSDISPDKRETFLAAVKEYFESVYAGKREDKHDNLKNLSDIDFKSLDLSAFSLRNVNLSSSELWENIVQPTNMMQMLEGAHEIAQELRRRQVDSKYEHVDRNLFLRAFWAIVLEDVQPPELSSQLLKISRPMVEPQSPWEIFEEVRCTHDVRDYLGNQGKVLSKLWETFRSEADIFLASSAGERFIQDFLQLPNCTHASNLSVTDRAWIYIAMSDSLHDFNLYARVVASICYGDLLGRSPGVEIHVEPTPEGISQILDEEWTAESRGQALSWLLSRFEVSSDTDVFNVFPSIFMKYLAGESTISSYALSTRIECAETHMIEALMEYLSGVQTALEQEDRIMSIDAIWTTTNRPEEKGYAITHRELCRLCRWTFRYALISCLRRGLYVERNPVCNLDEIGCTQITKLLSERELLPHLAGETSKLKRHRLARTLKKFWWPFTDLENLQYPELHQQLFAKHGVVFREDIEARGYRSTYGPEALPARTLWCELPTRPGSAS